jgi:hypothetical protein
VPRSGLLSVAELKNAVFHTERLEYVVAKSYRENMRPGFGR